MCDVVKSEPQFFSCIITKVVDQDPKVVLNSLNSSPQKKCNCWVCELLNFPFTNIKTKEFGI